MSDVSCAGCGAPIRRAQKTNGKIKPIIFDATCEYCNRPYPVPKPEPKSKIEFLEHISYSGSRAVVDGSVVLNIAVTTTS